MRFPSLPALARARPEAVLAAWSGLGYYRRARHLHEAARTVMREHGGRVPDDPMTFGQLPGVGRYTTGAVLSLLSTARWRCLTAMSRASCRASVRALRGSA
jgi:A/G-specific adenine glycosylase